MASDKAEAPCPSCDDDGPHKVKYDDGDNLKLACRTCGKKFKVDVDDDAEVVGSSGWW